MKDCNKKGRKNLKRRCDIIKNAHLFRCAFVNKKIAFKLIHTGSKKQKS